MSAKRGRHHVVSIPRLRAKGSCRSTRRSIVLAAVAWIALPRAGVARAQATKESSKPVRVGILATGTSTGKRITTERFVEPLRELGWIEDRNVVYDRGPEYGSKRMQLLREALPNLTRVGALKTARISRELSHIEQAAGAGIKVISAIANDPNELDSAFGLLAQERVEALLLTQMTFVGLRPVRKRILDFAAKQRIPVVGQRSFIVDDGALMSYSSILQEQVRRAMQLADKVLKGAKPADIPIEQPTKFELVLNLKTAKALALSIPQSVLIQATRVIE